ncbi:hypothetical protein [Pantoea dispersa]|uniref:hypothetical protein n=1 Tax=Pantoea dispersa TaxID=59814 RepID=UPI0018A82D2E|nr:hypothetical protein [Pantoea dispersa]
MSRLLLGISEQRLKTGNEGVRGHDKSRRDGIERLADSLLNRREGSQARHQA